MDKILLSYNFDPTRFTHGGFAELFESQRRDSAFAHVYEHDDAVYAIRDHLGIVPLFYRLDGSGLRFSTSLSDLIAADDSITEPGLRTLLSFGTPRLHPIVDQVGIVPPGSVLQLDPASGSVRTVYQYQIKPASLPVTVTMRDLVAEFDRLMQQAIARAVHADSVGLYLSGGIDSCLIGVYLKQAGVRVTAYTSAPWGRISSELPFAEQSARVIGVESHHVDVLETDRYLDAFQALPDLYGLPHGTTTGIGVASLWRSTPIGEEQQLFFGQNVDTLLCTVPAQYLVLFASQLPRPLLKRRIGVAYPEIARNYLAFASHHLLTDYPPLVAPCVPTGLSQRQQLVAAGMLAAHTPSDGEVLAQPAIRRGILVGNPYYDVDLIEFGMGVPLRHSLTFSTESKTLLTLEKRVIRRLALRFLPREQVFRKKGFSVSLERDERTAALVDYLPTRILSIPIRDMQNRFAAGVLKLWAERVGLRQPLFED